MELFKAQHIVKQFANHLALDQITVSVPEGSIYGLLGPNGAGKTTLIRIINQITAPDSGELFFKGNKLKSDDIYDIGYLPEERGLYRKMKVGEQSVYLARLKGLSRQDALKKLKVWFEKFEIEAWWDKKVEELSKGMQQKVQFIITVLHEPKLLIFDEPFTGFDPINVKILKKEILKLKDQGATIIFSTHDMGSVEELCSHITLINKARTLLEGSIDEIRKRYASNEYEIGFEGEANLLTATLSSQYKILEHKKVNGQSIVRIKLQDSFSTNDILKSLLQSGKIVSFNEIVPGMNDIFIRVVQEEETIKRT
jgi:ABC-2 type transport system ATP-binding protein